jgi:hypothetical protein
MRCVYGAQICAPDAQIGKKSDFFAHLAHKKLFTTAHKSHNQKIYTLRPPNWCAVKGKNGAP